MPLSQVVSVCRSLIVRKKEVSTTSVSDRGAKSRELLVGELHLSGGAVLLDVGDRAGARDGEHHGGAAQQPSQRQLRVGRLVVLGELVGAEARPGEGACTNRVPRAAADALPLAELEDV